MKELLFLIAEKIVTDKSENNIFICLSILKDEFIKMGYSNVNANTMAIDSLKIVMKTLISITN
jgi:hypothetical protein